MRVILETVLVDVGHVHDGLARDQVQFPDDVPLGLVQFK